MRRFLWVVALLLGLLGSAIEAIEPADLYSLLSNQTEATKFRSAWVNRGKDLRSNLASAKKRGDQSAVANWSVRLQIHAANFPVSVPDFDVENHFEPRVGEVGNWPWSAELLSAETSSRPQIVRCTDATNSFRAGLRGVAFKDWYASLSSDGPNAAIALEVVEKIKLNGSTEIPVFQPVDWLKRIDPENRDAAKKWLDAAGKKSALVIDSSAKKRSKIQK